MSIVNVLGDGFKKNIPPLIHSGEDPCILGQITGCTGLLVSFRHDLKQLRKTWSAPKKWF